METLDLKYFKEKLEQEKERVIAELKTVGRINPDNPEDWEPIPGKNDGNISDPNDLADTVEEYEGNTALVAELEIQLKDINDALEKIENDKYGICEISGEQIEKERLEANPAARTCKKHINN